MLRMVAEKIKLIFDSHDQHKYIQLQQSKMVIFSTQFLSMFLLSLLVISAVQQCPTADTSLPLFHAMPVTLSKMYNKNPATKTGSQISQYLLNLPRELLNPTYSKNTNILLSLNKIEIDAFVNLFAYRIRFSKNFVNVLITFESPESRWTDLSINTIIFSGVQYQSLLFGQISAINSQSRLSLNLQQTLPKSPVLSASTPPKLLVFLTGINMARKNDSDYSYELIITEKIDIINTKVSINVKSGEYNILNEVYVSYVVIYPGATNYQITANYLENSDIGVGKTSRTMSLTSWKYWAIGLSSFKFKTGPGFLSLSIEPSPLKQSNIQYTTSFPIQFLKVPILQISKPVQNQCKACYQLPIIYNKGLSTTCVSTCPEGIQTIDQGVRKCLVCDSQNGYMEINGVCSCAGKLKEVGGQCIQSKKADLKAFFSTTNSECIDPNSYSTGNGCQCKPGYSKQAFFNQFKCVSICPLNSYFDGSSCITCSPGTFADTTTNRCQICASNCEQCKSQFACNRCVSGYITNSIGKCQQICGDGILMQKNNASKCDDGNNQDSDGCSSLCEVQSGWKCTLVQGLSHCTQEIYSVRRKTNKFIPGGIYVLEYQLSPAPKSPIPASQIQQIAKIIYYNSPPYQSYIKNNPIDTINFIGTYGGYTPAIPATIHVQIKLPNGQIFAETFEQNIAPPDLKMNSRNINGPNGSNDRLS